MIISYSHTTPALLAGRKTVTRRAWKPVTAAYFEKRLARAERIKNVTAGLATVSGQEVQLGVLADAYDKSTRQHGHKVAEVLVTSVTSEALSDMPDSDYEAEGLAYLDEIGYPPEGDPWGVAFCTTWRQYFDLSRTVRPSPLLWVVRFELVRVAR